MKRLSRGHRAYLIHLAGGASPSTFRWFGKYRTAPSVGWIVAHWQKEPWRSIYGAENVDRVRRSAEALGSTKRNQWHRSER